MTIMLRWERKVVDWVEHNLHIFVFFLLTFVLVYMRKGVFYHEIFDMEAALVAEDPGFYHAPGYRMFLSLLFRVPIRPVLAVKITVIVFDFFVALTAMWICYRVLEEKKRTILPIICYGVLAISPLIIEYGSVWNRLECVSMFLVLLAYALRLQGNKIVPVILMGVTVALSPIYFVFVPAFPPKDDTMQKKAMVWVGVLLIFSTVTIISAVALGVTWGEIGTAVWGIFFREPMHGGAFNSFSDCFLTVVLRCGYTIGVVAVMNCFLGNKNKILSAVTHVVLIGYMGFFLQYGYWWM